MSTVTAKLIGVLQQTVPAGLTVDIALCSYQSRNPVSRAPVGDNGTFADINLLGVAPTQAGDTISVDLIGNDVIVPAGTYYTFTFRNGNGDILQVNAYTFVDGNDYDLTGLDPIDPNQPPPPPPQPISNLLLVVPPDAPDFDGSQFTTWQMTLDQDVTTATLTGIVPGNLYTFIIVQDGSGNHVFLFPSGTHNQTAVCMKPNAQTTQTFVADENGELWAIGPGTWVTP